MEVELMFFDCMNNSNNKNTAGQGGKDANKDANKNENKDNVNTTTNTNKSKEECCLFNESKSLSTLKYKINEVADGVHEFIPVLFEEANFCVANILLHTIRLGTLQK